MRGMRAAAARGPIRAHARTCSAKIRVTQAEFEKKEGVEVKRVALTADEKKAKVRCMCVSMFVFMFVCARAHWRADAP